MIVIAVARLIDPEAYSPESDAALGSMAVKIGMRRDSVETHARSMINLIRQMPDDLLAAIKASPELVEPKNRFTRMRGAR